MTDEEDSTDGRFPYGGAPARPTSEDERWRNQAAQRRGRTGAPVAVAELIGQLARVEPRQTGGLPRGPDGRLQCSRCGKPASTLHPPLYAGGDRSLCPACVGQDARAVVEQIRLACRAYKAGRREAAEQLVDLMGRGEAENWMRDVDAKAEGGGKGGSW